MFFFVCTNKGTNIFSLLGACLSILRHLVRNTFGDIYTPLWKENRFESAIVVTSEKIFIAVR